MSESCHIRAVTKISSHWVYAVNGRGIEQLGLPLVLFSFFFPDLFTHVLTFYCLKRNTEINIGGGEFWSSNLCLLLLVPVYTSWMFDLYLLKSKCKYCIKIFYHHQQTVQKDSYTPCNDYNAQGLWDCSPWCEEEAVKDRNTTLLKGMFHPSRMKELIF